MGNKSLQLNEDLLGEILGVPMGVIRFVVGKRCSVEFVNECSKIPKTLRARVLKNER